MIRHGVTTCISNYIHTYSFLFYATQPKYYWNLTILSPLLLPPEILVNIEFEFVGLGDEAPLPHIYFHYHFLTLYQVRCCITSIYLRVWKHFLTILSPIVFLRLSFWSRILLYFKIDGGAGSNYNGRILLSFSFCTFQKKIIFSSCTVLSANSSYKLYIYFSCIMPECSCEFDSVCIDIVSKITFLVLFNLLCHFYYPWFL